MLACPTPPPPAAPPPPRRPCAASCSSRPTLPARRTGYDASASPCAGWKGARASAPRCAPAPETSTRERYAPSYGELRGIGPGQAGARLGRPDRDRPDRGQAGARRAHRPRHAARDDRRDRRGRVGGALGATPHLMPYIVICLSFGLAGGLVGKIKGSSFFLWFMISAILPFLGLIAAIAYRNDRDELRRRCPGCGKVVKLHDALCTR